MRDLNSSVVWAVAADSTQSMFALLYDEYTKCNMYVVYLFLYFVYLVSADPDIGDIDGK